MNTRPAVRAGLTKAQATAQTFLLIIVSFTAGWLCVYRVPWQVSGDPCLLALGVTVVIVTCLWLTRVRGLPGSKYRKNGIGTATLRRLIEEVRFQSPGIVLSVRTDNPAMRLYERLSFKVIPNSQMINRVGTASIHMYLDLRLAMGTDRSPLVSDLKLPNSHAD